MIGEHPFLLFLKVSSLKNKTFKNFSRLFHCSVINVLLLIFVISSPEQLWYHIMSFAVCQELFSTFLFFFFAVWPEVFSNFFVKAFVLRRFLNSEVYNTIVLFVCQQLFSFFFIFFHFFNIAFRIPHRRKQSGSLYKSKKKRQEMPCISCRFIYLSFIISLYSSVIYNKCFASSSFSPETRSPPVSPAKSPEICPAHRPEVLLVFSENQTFWSGSHPVSVICISFPLWLHCLISCTFLPSYPPKNNVKFR